MTATSVKLDEVTLLSRFELRLLAPQPTFAASDLHALAGPLAHEVTLDYLDNFEGATWRRAGGSAGQSPSWRSCWSTLSISVAIRAVPVSR